jgi:type VI protein secretion system component Hcp
MWQIVPRRLALGGAAMNNHYPRRWLPAMLQRSVVAALLVIAGTGAASAYVGKSYMDIPGIAGGAKARPHKNWLTIEAHYWQSDDTTMFSRSSRNFKRLHSRSFFSGPAAPQTGASQLTISIDKRNPALPKLMEMCASKAKAPMLNFAESSVLARALPEVGPRPADVPEYFEYKLKDAEFSDCPIVDGAPEQAIVVSFNDIEWVNYHETGEGKALTLEPAVLKEVKSSGATKSFVVSWIALAHDVSSDQCAKPNEKPSQEDYYALMSEADAAKERAELASKGGVNYENGTMDHRGPHKLNACLLPGILKDPGLITPQTDVARGLNLDGDDGAGNPPRGIRKHKNYVSEDGRTGIDNQLYTVEGCVPGYQGHKGFYLQYSNEQRRNGLLSVLVQISGIDNEQNDNSVDVALLYSKEPMVKSASGKEILSDATFRLTDNPEFAHYAIRMHGRIVNGVILTDPVKQLQMHLGIDPELTLYDARMRLQIMPDGTLKGVLGGYQDWRRIMMVNANSTAESYYGFQCPAMYNAFKRLADGLKDPDTGEYNGVSSAYDVEGVPAFVVPARNKSLVAQAEAHSPKAP